MESTRTTHVALGVGSITGGILSVIGTPFLVAFVSAGFTWALTLATYVLKRWHQPDHMDPTERLQCKLAWLLLPPSKQEVWAYLDSFAQDEKIAPQRVIDTLERDHDVMGSTRRHHLAWTVHPHSPDAIREGYTTATAELPAYDNASEQYYAGRIGTLFKNALCLHDSYGRRI